MAAPDIAMANAMQTCEAGAELPRMLLQVNHARRHWGALLAECRSKPLNYTVADLQW